MMMRVSRVGRMKFQQATRAASSGFTLIELMIVVAVIGILGAIAYANYSDSVVKSRRAAAAACLLETSQYMERYYTTKLSYVGAAPPAQECQSEMTDHYTIGLDGTPTATAYRVQAAPKGQQLAKDTKCGTLGLNQQGARSQASTGTVAYCW